MEPKELIEEKTMVELNRIYEDIGILLNEYPQYLLSDPKQLNKRDNPFNNKDYEETVEFLKELGCSYTDMSILGTLQIVISETIREKATEYGII